MISQLVFHSSSSNFCQCQLMSESTVIYITLNSLTFPEGCHAKHRLFNVECVIVTSLNQNDHVVSWHVIKCHHVKLKDIWWHLDGSTHFAEHFMTYDDIWWHFMTYDDIWWHFMTKHVGYHDISWHVMTSHEMTPSDSERYLTTGTQCTNSVSTVFTG